MKILLDECAPKDLKLTLTRHGYECLTVQEMGWSGKKNGELLGLAEADEKNRCASHKCQIQ